MLDVNEKLNRQKMQIISKKCYSNIFIYEKKRENIVGFINTKQLIEYVDKDF